MSEETDAPIWPRKEDDVSARALIEFYLYKADLLSAKADELIRLDGRDATRLISEMHGLFNTAWLLSVMRDEGGTDYADEQAKRIWWIAESGEYGEYAFEIKKRLA